MNITRITDLEQRCGAGTISSGTTIADTIRELSDEDYHFIRIGEDYDDIDVRGTFLDNPFELSIQRSISLHE